MVLVARKMAGNVCRSLGGAGRPGHWYESRLPLAACRSVLEQDTEPHIAPDEQLAPCMAAPAITV